MGKIPSELLDRLNGLISSLMGLSFTRSRMGDLERGIAQAAADFGFEDAEAFAGWLMKTPLKKEHIERLASHLTIGETYFFRDSSSMEGLEREILPALIESRRLSKRIRVWSAGCSTGEEPYSVAMILTRLVPDIESWNIGILATDINASALRKASAGVYTSWSFRETPGWVRDRHFRPAGEGSWRIDPAIQRMVSFGYLNLAEDIYPSLLNNTNGVDIILCRNVIMYFSDEVARSVVTGLRNSLVDGGWLLVSPAEAVRAVSGLFQPVNIGGAIFYRKTETDTGVAAPPSEFRPPVPWPPVTEPFQEATGERPEGPEAKAGPEAGEQAALEAEAEAPGADPLADANGLFALGLYGEAARALEELSEGDRGRDGALLLARAYANMGALEEAARWCESVQAAEPLDKAAYILLATIRQEQARREDAVRNLKKALYLDQDFVVAHFMLGRLLAAEGSAEQARRHITTALRLLERSAEDEVVPDSGGMMAGRLRDITALMLKGLDG